MSESPGYKTYRLLFTLDLAVACEQALTDKEWRRKGSRACTYAIQFCMSTRPRLGRENLIGRVVSNVIHES